MNTSLVREKIEEYAKVIVKKFDPEKVILFGSYARGTPGPNSDADLLVVAQTTNTRRLAQDIDASLWGRTLPLDILVYTPETVAGRLSIGDFFMRDIIEKGRTLYEKRY